MDWWRTIRALLPLLAGGLVLWMIAATCDGFGRRIPPPAESTGRQIAVHSSITSFPRGLDASELVHLIERSRTLPDRTVTVPTSATDPGSPSFLLPRPWLKWMMDQGYISTGPETYRPNMKSIGFTEAGERDLNPRIDHGRRLWVVPLTRTTIQTIDSLERTESGDYRVKVSWTQELTPLGDQIHTVRSRGEGATEATIAWHPSSGWNVRRPRARQMPR